MSTRLERLLTLLDKGSTPLSRKAAAVQIGEIIKFHPDELLNLLFRIHEYLKSANWDTRTAAAEAIKQVAVNIPKWPPASATFSQSDNKRELNESNYQLSFDNFDIHRLVENGRAMFSSGGSEYDFEEGTLTAAQRLEYHKRNLQSQLELNLAFNSNIGIDIKMEDLEVFKETPSKRTASTSEDSSAFMKGLSARQKIQHKRLLRTKKASEQTFPKEKPNCFTGGNVEGHVSTHTRPSSRVFAAGSEDFCCAWPFEEFCEELCCDLFASSWEIRHGAAAALREIILSHGEGAGMILNESPEEQRAAHYKWLEDVAIRILCVFALDKVGDFAFDQVVAPVRETSAQALGALLKYMPDNLIEKVLLVLLQLQTRDSWDIRYGGLLGLKYILNVRKDLTSRLLPQVLPALLCGLKDREDDVRAVSAECLIPVLPELVTGSSDSVPLLLQILWGLLLDLDDVTSSTVHVVSLLGRLLSYSSAMKLNEKATGMPFSQLVPRLTSFFRHGNKKVRMASLNALATIVSSAASAHWMSLVGTDLLKAVFLCFLVDDDEDVYDSALTVWKELLEAMTRGNEDLYQFTAPLFHQWLTMTCAPRGFPFSHDSSMVTSTVFSDRRNKIMKVDIMPYDRDASVRIRLISSCALALLCTFYKSVEHFKAILVYFGDLLSSLSYSNRLITGLFLTELAALYFTCDERTHNFPDILIEKVHNVLTDPYEVLYTEMEPLRKQMRGDIYDIINSFRNRGLPQDAYYEVGDFRTYNEELACEFLNNIFPKWWKQMHASIARSDSRWMNVESQRIRLEETIKKLSEEQSKENTSILSSLAYFSIQVGRLLPKLNPIVQPLMKSLRSESNVSLQMRSAKGIALLLKMNVSHQKIIRNIISFACADPTVKPPLPVEYNTTVSDGIWSLEKELLTSNPKSFKQYSENDEKLDAYRIQGRGGLYALCEICRVFDKELFLLLPVLLENFVEPIKNFFLAPNGTLGPVSIESLLNSLHFFIILVPLLHVELRARAFACCEYLLVGLKSSFKCIRYMSSQCFAVLCKCDTYRLVTFVIENILPQITHADCLVRQGCIESIYVIVERLEYYIVPFLAFLVIPVLGRMSDEDADVRHLAASCFAALVKLMPLEVGSAGPIGLKPDLIDQWKEERKFVLQLLDNTLTNEIEIPSIVRAELRSYQREGVNWLFFLKKYNLHGILGDDMGLGKTLQSICIMSLTLDEKGGAGRPLAHLVVCPSTLCGHWQWEIQNFSSLRPFSYVGTVLERANLRTSLTNFDVIITSYEVLKKDIDFLSTMHFSYCILDEGHIIKNSRNKLSLSSKKIHANHRLILSGTPIQNNVLELWSLFDFLMPGFLGTERQFYEKYEKPIMHKGEEKPSTPKNDETAMLALENLHRQVLPFILRRVKEDVLKDLPPKIIQDYYCQLSPLQASLYDEFSKTLLGDELRSAAWSLQDGQTPAKKSSSSEEASVHIFQALQYLRKLCSHPKLVLTNKHPEYLKLQSENVNINSIEHSPKLVALKQLLNDCGIGVDSGQEDTSLSTVTNHRVLIFCQLKAMLDIIETDCLASFMPQVTYLRLDGNTELSKRHEIVQKFNCDPTIDLLLLTTHIGGLGLNLTGADTVIFMEHDWNPMKDLQAMDRAHRIGQKKVVNVYRFIMKNTLEEKIMGLQKFKLNLANTVISTENASLQGLNTTQLLDLLGDEKKSKASSKSNSESKQNLREVVEQLSDLWEQSQYDEEYNLDSFLEKLS